MAPPSSSNSSNNTHPFGTISTARPTAVNQDYALALALQNSFWQEVSSSVAAAAAAHASLPVTTSSTAAAAAAASTTQEEPATIKAWKFVEAIMRLHETSPSKPELHYLFPVAMDDMVALAERMLVAQEDFRRRSSTAAAGIAAAAAAAADSTSTQVDLGYHYTQSENLHNIRTDGLLSKKERERRQITAKFNGSRYGDGIYSSNTPTSFERYTELGNIGLLVARLQGRRVDWKMADSSNIINGHNTTVVEDKFVVLQKRYQCLPLFSFPTKLVKEPDGHALILELQEKVQAVVDEFFNPDSSIGGTTRDEPSSPRSIFPLRRDYKAPNSLATTTTELDSLVTKVSAALINDYCTTCSVCSKSLVAVEITPISLRPHGNATTAAASSSSIVAWKVCGHWLHQKCAYYTLSHGCAGRCTTCSVPIQEPRGTMPSGSTIVTLDKSMTCPGFEPLNDTSKGGTFCLRYKIPAGKQKQYHPNPGRPHGAADRLAYVPNTTQGRKLLDRLVYAFEHGLIFTVGTSETSGQSNVVKWSTISHKTKLKGGIVNHGYPDPTYLTNCHKELDAVGVPPDCQPIIQPKAAAAAAVKPKQPETVLPPLPTILPPLPCRLNYKAPISLVSVSIETLVNTITGSLSAIPEATAAAAAGGSTLNECPICQCHLDPSHQYGSSCEQVVAWKACGHELHKLCAQQVLTNDTRCPICRVHLTEPRGKMPSGTISISKDPSMHCSGFEASSVGTLVIRYIIPTGIQKDYHENPGKAHRSADRTAYVPNTVQGQRLVKRLIYAFEHGLTFTVGTSATSGKWNQVIWASIHHKTKIQGGIQNYGFPDEGYFINCNEELDNAGVPKSTNEVK